MMVSRDKIPDGGIDFEGLQMISIPQDWDDAMSLAIAAYFGVAL